MKELEIKNQTIKNQEELINSLKESIINLKDIIDINEKQLILSGVSNRRELCEGKCGMSYCDDNGCLNKKEILGEPKDTSIVE